jgi:hypothetical protein
MLLVPILHLTKLWSAEVKFLIQDHITSKLTSQDLITSKVHITIPRDKLLTPVMSTLLKRDVRTFLKIMVKQI